MSVDICNFQIFVKFLPNHDLFELLNRMFFYFFLIFHLFVISFVEQNAFCRSACSSGQYGSVYDSIASGSHIAQYLRNLNFPQDIQINCFVEVDPQVLYNFVPTPPTGSYGKYGLSHSTVFGFPYLNIRFTIMFKYVHCYACLCILIL